MLTVVSGDLYCSQINMQFRKIFMEVKKSKKIKRNWTRQKNFDICFRAIFGCYDQSLTKLFGNS